MMCQNVFQFNSTGEQKFSSIFVLSPWTWSRDMDNISLQLVALSGFIAFQKGWAPLSQEKEGWWARGRAQCRYNAQDKHVGGARYSADMCFSLHHHLFTRYHSEAATVTCNPMSILQVAHGAGTPKRVHRYREKQEGLTVTPPQLKFKSLLQCTHFQSVLCKGDNLSLRSSFCLSGGQWGGCAHAQVFQWHAQRATDALQNIHHLLCGEISYCKIREEEVVQKSSLRHYLSQPQKESSYFPFNGFISHSLQVKSQDIQKVLLKILMLSPNNLFSFFPFLFSSLFFFFFSVFLPSF